MDVNIEESWKHQLSDEFSKEYFQKLSAFVKEEYRNGRCYPPGGRIFAAFDHTPFDKVRVVILGQDPYHGPGQANGLCFSVQEGIAKPPSLQNIFRELCDDLQLSEPANGDLEPWADRGVLLLNATLTVRAHQAGSHQNKGWEQFTDSVIQILSEKQEHLVFLLWGGYAKKKGARIDRSKHLVLTSGHPSPLSANRGLWFGNKHFSKTNDYLKEIGNEPINWQL
ncbi:uracil-DNA glycosylase [Aureitalea sp. L0-47]|uniref:uracil-DNA glycosylase n=1 Tax=Aureitalea sp. L0-47 TaxID=2816962 RepID=UPI002238AC9A|nr:uracil-DNA glycosylase [Aureitalea sp. L0-47]MCW5519372.1 uracil-DNA glycosylase [Aureitalea sp. L0-47]